MKLLAVINSLPKQATRWVAEMMVQNIDRELCKERGATSFLIKHEAITKDRGRVRRLWRETDDLVSVFVGPASHAMARIQRETPEAKWACLWREPIAHFLSVAVMKSAGVTSAALNYAARFWALREHSLVMAEKLGIDVSHWHMDFVATEVGYRSLMASLDIPCQEQFKLLTPIGVTGPLKKAAIEDFDGSPDQVRAEVLELFDSFERSKAVYDGLRREAK